MSDDTSLKRGDWWTRLAMIKLYVKFEIFIFIRYEERKTKQQDRWK